MKDYQSKQNMIDRHKSGYLPTLLRGLIELLLMPEKIFDSLRRSTSPVMCCYWIRCAFTLN